MRYEAMKRQGKRTDLDDTEKGASIDELAKDYDCSPDTLRRLFRMTELIPGLLPLVDEKKLAFNSAVEISYLNKGEQEMVRAFMEADDVSPSLAQARELRNISKAGEITDEKVMEILLKTEEIRKADFSERSAQSRTGLRFAPVGSERMSTGHPEPPFPSVGGSSEAL